MPTIDEVYRAPDLSGRKKRQLLHEQAVEKAARIMDVFRCVDRLAGVTAPELRKLAAREASTSSSSAAAAAAGGATGATLSPSSPSLLRSPSPPGVGTASASAAYSCPLRLGRLVATGGAVVDQPLRVDLKALIAALPLHAVACLLSGGDDDDDESDDDDDGNGGGKPTAPVPITPNPSVLSPFARWVSKRRLTSYRLTATCAADHAARALRLVAAIAGAADTAPAVFSALSEVTDDCAVVAFSVGGGGGGAGASSSAPSSASKKQKTSPAATTASPAARAKRPSNPFRTGLVDALALATCAVAGSVAVDDGGGENSVGLLADAASLDPARRERARAWIALVPAALDAAFTALAPRVPDPHRQRLLDQQQRQQQQQHRPLASAEDPDARARAAALEVLSSPRAATAVVPGVADAVRAGILATRAVLESWRREAEIPDSLSDADALASSVAAIARAAGAGLDELGKALSIPLFYAGFASREGSLASLARVVSEAASLAAVGHEAALHERKVRQSEGDGTTTTAATTSAVLPYEARTALDLLAARGFALFVALSELAEPPFLDVIFESRDDDGDDGEKKKTNKKPTSTTRPAAVFAADAALEAAGRAFRRGPVTPGDPATSAGEGHLASAALAAAELLTDDSNHRAAAAELLAAPLAEALSYPPTQFASSWCCGSDGAARHAEDAMNAGGGVFGGASASAVATPLQLAPPTPEAVARALTLARVVEVLRPALVAKAAAAAAAASGTATTKGESARTERDRAAAAARGVTASAGRCLALFKILGNMQVEGGGRDDGEEEGTLAAKKLVRELVRRTGTTTTTAVSACTTALINLRALSAAAARLRKAAERGAAADAAQNSDGVFTWYADDLLTRGEQQLLDDFAAAVKVSAERVDEAVGKATARAAAPASPGGLGLCGGGLPAQKKKASAASPMIVGVSGVEAEVVGLMMRRSGG